MVKERSYKILEQLDEYELQDAGASSVAVYGSDSEAQLTREQRANVVPSAADHDEDDDADGDAGNGNGNSGEARPAPAAAAAAAAAAPVATVAAATVPRATDGVFSNMSARPELYMGYDDKIPSEALPTYQDIYGPQSSGAPPYFEAAVISVGDEDELLVEGLPVGSAAVFVANMVVSALFQVVGYMLTFLLHSSHAARNGSLAGLGITFMNFGLYIRTHIAQDGQQQSPPSSSPPGDGQLDADTPLDNVYFAYLLMVIGACIIAKSIFDYVRVRRLQTIIESSPEQNV
ncbi:hypothetical protein H4R18_002013 [Coemansia javaensis]|uniref:Metal homeostatis protein bsd2 n=1 Tax=Coemansia javaensis TaxID=2761396 RepID=A0A9W8HHX4_9FUNG|nr:hypothetical protein H4R18_002013 [Coemansia javaensis]